MKTFVVGLGSWGTALANVLADNGQIVKIYGRNEKEVSNINNLHVNEKYLPLASLNPTLKATNDFLEVNDYDVVLLAVPSNVSLSIIDELNNVLTHKVIIINVAKGFDSTTHERLSQVITRRIKAELLTSYFALIGPSHAEEVVQRKITTVNIVGEDEELSKQLQELFSNDYFRVYRNNDMIGCEYASGLKNIIALASGMIYGLDMGDNAKASLMTRGLSEMSRFGMAKGGLQESFMGLCGMGDLIVTCTSKYSRNFQAGFQIGKDDSAATFLATNKSTVEGINACRIIYEEARNCGISMPITNEVYEILFEKKKPSIAINDLMKRSLKYEIY